MVILQKTKKSLMKMKRKNHVKKTPKTMPMTTNQTIFQKKTNKKTSLTKLKKPNKKYQSQSSHLRHQFFSMRQISGFQILALQNILLCQHCSNLPKVCSNSARLEIILMACWARAKIEKSQMSCKSFHLVLGLNLATLRRLLSGFSISLSGQMASYLLGDVIVLIVKRKLFGSPRR